MEKLPQKILKSSIIIKESNHKWEVKEIIYIDIDFYHWFFLQVIWLKVNEKLKLEPCIQSSH